MSVSLTRFSRLKFANLLSEEGFEFWQTLYATEIGVHGDDVTYIIRQNDRIDRLASSFYGDPVLWWVIALANNLEFLPTDLMEGQTLRIPSPRYVTTVLFTSPTIK